MAPTVDAPAKLELRPKMNLSAHENPWLQVVVKNRKSQILSHVHCRLLSLVITPDTHSILYLECVCTSTATAHAVMAASVETANTVQNWAFCPTKKSGWNITPGDNMRVADVRLALKGHSGLHHFALMNQSETFLLARNHDELWTKLRKAMSCPTKEAWGKDLMPKVMDAGLLIECESFGLPMKNKPTACTRCEGSGTVGNTDHSECTCHLGHPPCQHCVDGTPCDDCDGTGLNKKNCEPMTAYILELDAEESFDTLVGEYVKSHGF